MALPFPIFAIASQFCSIKSIPIKCDDSIFNLNLLLNLKLRPAHFHLVNNLH